MALSIIYFLNCKQIQEGKDDKILTVCHRLCGGYLMWGICKKKVIGNNVGGKVSQKEERKICEHNVHPLQ